jgi:hypothetical protein
MDSDLPTGLELRTAAEALRTGTIAGPRAAAAVARVLAMVRTRWPLAGQRGAVTPGELAAALEIASFHPTAPALFAAHGRQIAEALERLQGPSP